MPGFQAHPYQQTVIDLARQKEKDPRFAKLAVGILKSESSTDDPNKSSGKGARGPMQIMPKTFADYRPDGDVNDPKQSVPAAIDHLHSLWKHYGGDAANTAAAYNAGQGRVDSGEPLPKETQAYVPKVQSNMGRYVINPPAGRFHIQPAQDAYIMDPKIIAKANDAGYDWKAAKQIGMSDQQILDYVSKHPNYKTEQQGVKEQAGRSGLENFAEGAAHAGRGMLRGVAQDVVGPLQKVLPPGVPNKAELAQNQALDDARSKATISQGAGKAGDVLVNSAPYLAVPQGRIAKGAGDLVGAAGATRVGEYLANPKNILPAMGDAAAQGAIGGALLQPRTPDDSLGTNMVGGALAGAVGQGAGRLFGFATNPNMSRLNPETAELRDIGRNYGFEFSPGQATGHPWVQALEKKFGRFVPGVSGKLADQAENNQAVTNKLVNSSVGLKNQPNFNEDTRTDAANEVGSMFDLAKNRSINFGPRYNQSIARELREQTSLPENDPEYIASLQKWSHPENFPNATTLSGNTWLPGSDLIGKNRARSILASKANETGNWGLVNSMDDAIEHSLPGYSVPAWNTARESYRNLLAVNKAANPNYPGVVDTARLATALKQQKRMDTSPGIDPLVDAAKINQALKNREPDSGTSHGMLALGMGAHAGKEGGLGDLALAATGLPLVGRAAASNTAGQYLTEGIPLLRNLDPATNALMNRASTALPVGYEQNLLAQ